jgi:multiple sugar transport system permease protein
MNTRISKMTIYRSAITLFVLLVSITMIMPFIWMISASIKVEADVFKFPIEWIPARINAIANYTEVWTGKYNFALYYFNTIKLSVLTTVCQVLISAMGAYAFAKINFKYKNRLFIAYLATLMVPDQITLIPRFILLKSLKLYDTHLGLILLLSFSVYGIFLLKQYMLTIPDSLLESARIDGSNHFMIFTRIILPISKPAIATLAILKFCWTWNDYQYPLVFLKSKELYTIQLGMKQFSSETGTYYSLVMAAAVCAIVPLFIVFIIGQRYLVDGITAGAVKG